MKIPLISLAMVLLMAGCQSHPMGMTETEWHSLSPEQQAGYRQEQQEMNVRQQQEQQARAAVEQQQRREQEQRDQERLRAAYAFARR